MSDVAHILSQIAVEGWDAFDEAKLAAAQAADAQADRERMRREAAIVGAVLDSAAGDRFVALLVEKTFFAEPPAPIAAPSGAETYAIAAAQREGQKQVVAMIRSMLAFARDKEGEKS